MNRLWSMGGMAALLVAVAHPAAGQARPADRQLVLKTEGDRLAAIALLERLNADLLASSSATLTLEAWCADQGLAQPATILAEQVPTARRPATDAQRRRLRVGPDEPVRYRKVKLKCGAHVLSEAENWYVPSRLTPAMNALLEESRTPFGKVVRPLRPQRRTFALTRHWEPLLRFDGASGAAQAWSPASCDATAFSHGALVLNDRNEPIAEVAEAYKLALLCGLFPAGRGLAR